MRATAGWLLALALAFTARAAEPPLLAAAAELPVVLSATRLRQPALEAPVSVTVIDRELMEASGATELPELFRLAPGFLVGHLNGHHATVGYHGLLDPYARRMQVLVDGRSVYTPAFGGVRWSNLPLVMEDIARIEIIRAPNAAAYGPNAFQGIVNIVTETALETRNGAAVAAGEPGRRRAVLRLAGARGERAFRASLAYRRDDGFSGRNDDAETAILALRADLPLGPAEMVELQGGYNHGRHGQGDGVDQFGFDDRRSDETDTGFVQGRWRRVLGPGEELTLLAYHRRERTRDRESGPATIPLPGLGDLPLEVEADLGRDARRTDLELQHVVAPRPGTRIVWGLEARHDEVEAPGLLAGGSFSNDLWRLFGNLEQGGGGRLVWNAGAMAEANRVSGTRIAPRLGVNLRIAPGHALRLTVAGATRNPSAVEAAGDFAFFGRVTDPLQAALLDGVLDALVGTDVRGDLVMDHQFLTRRLPDPEEMRSLELGWIFRAGPVAGDLKLFTERLDGLVAATKLTLAAKDGVYNVDGKTGVFVNRNDVRLHGLELQLDARPGRRNRIHLAYALTDADASGEDAQDLEESVPRQNLALLLTRRLAGGLRASAAAYYVSGMRFLDVGATVGAYRRLDLTLSGPLAGAGRGARWRLALQNVDGADADLQPDNRLDTRLQAGVTLPL
ncbi:TonB-dependent receptor plug domain-containing protein [Inmirania thermothiophila]|uniref:Iron complex outermembrane receptor protein n=1 Tax=Inmirania thermothiophila TaxID=1750597 RepID=A0A3N1Y0U9_9GAMM|nr:TonB-dependent receptor [Inmirania thermothiophila]ROR32138.1 iron complex outermembrane receptor protein [Inmirania thermothiophila]